MDKLYAGWRKQLDEFDGAVLALSSLERGVRVWGALAPAVPALFDAMMREVGLYGESARALRTWMAEHDKDAGDPAEFGKYVLGTIDAARRLKGVIDAYNREKVFAEAAYPEMAGGSLKQTPVLTPPPLDPNAIDAKGMETASHGHAGAARVRVPESA